MDVLTFLQNVSTKCDGMMARSMMPEGGWGPQVIDMLCTETSSLIDEQSKIQVLAGVHYKLGKTLQDVENIMALPAEAAAAEEMLRDDNQLLQVPPCLRPCCKDPYPCP